MDAMRGLSLSRFLQRGALDGACDSDLAARMSTTITGRDQLA
jgi:hypothetical protein